MPQAELRFRKYHGAGNDFVCVDDRHGGFERWEQRATIARLCDRRYGIGGDGLILLRHFRATGADLGQLHMVYYNSDGRPSSFCGNGSRCFLRFALDLRLLSLPTYGVPAVGVAFMANDGLHTGWVLSREEFRVSMRVDGRVERLSDVADRVETGSPHYVEWCRDLPEGDITARAHGIRYSAAFAKTGINVNYAVAPGSSEGPLRVRTYERGVEGETEACGTGVTAVALGFAERRQVVGPQVTVVRAVGGELTVAFVREADGSFRDVTLAGPAAFVFEGVVD